MRWLCHHRNAQQNLANLADILAPGQEMSNSDSRTAPILTALKCAHGLLLADCECPEWGSVAGPASSDASVVNAGPDNAQNLTAGSTRPSKPP